MATRPAVVPPLGRGALVRKLGNDPRTLLMGPSLLLLQVAHPVVGAGVADHSDYATDPFGRLIRTLAGIEAVVYGGDGAPAAAAEMREFHRTIKGTRPDGRRYRAFDPEAWAWVHATLGWGMHAAARRFGRPLTDRQAEQLWEEWSEVGELLRVRPGQLPETWAGVPGYLDDMVAGRLERTAAFESVMGRSFQRLPRPGFLPVPAPVWRAGTVGLTGPLTVLAVGGLPASARRVLDLRWTPAHRRAFSAICTGLQASGAVARRVPRLPWQSLAG